MDIEFILNHLEWGDFDLAKAIKNITLEDVDRITKEINNFIRIRKGKMQYPKAGKNRKSFIRTQEKVIERLKKRLEIIKEKERSLKEAAPQQPTQAPAEQPATPTQEQERLPFSLDAQATRENNYARTNGLQIVRNDYFLPLDMLAQFLAGKNYILDFNGFVIEGRKYNTAEEIIAAYKQFRDKKVKKTKTAQPQQPTQAPTGQNQPRTDQSQVREDQAKEARAAYQTRANNLAAHVQNVGNIRERIEDAKTRDNMSRLDKEMRAVEAEMGKNNEYYKILEAQRRETKRNEKKEQKKEIKSLNSNLKTEMRRVGIKEGVKTSLLKQRDNLAAEIEKMKSLYGTVQTEEYQMRVAQLKELDKKIFGKRKAKRIYRDLNKPIALIGGFAVEVPKDYLDMRLAEMKRNTR